MSKLDSLGTMDITGTTNDKGALIREGHDSVHELVKHGSSFELTCEVEVLIWDALGDPVRALLHEGTIGVGSNDKLSGGHWHSLIHDHLRSL